MSAQGSEQTAVVQAVADSLWPGRFGTPLARDTPLGEDGLELDSIELVELVVECERRIGLPPGSSERLLEAGPLTVGALADHLAGA